MNALERGLQKLGAESANFVEMAARRIIKPRDLPRERICRRWSLSYEQEEVLGLHFAREIADKVQELAAPAYSPPTFVERSLPVGDR